MITNFNKLSQKSIVIVSCSLEEAITKCVLTNRMNFGENIKVISLQELISDYEICDRINDEGACIKWIKDLDHSVSNADYYLLSRVLYIPNALFNNFTKIDREYAQRELEAYIGFSFNAFCGIGNQFANGACVENISLPQQWSRVTKEFEMNTPNYYWGPHVYNSLNTKNRLVYSKIYNFLNWSTNSSPIREKHIFCFEKPQGQPVFIVSIGNEQLITSDVIFSKEIENKLKRVAGMITKFFNHFISEIVLFVDGEDLIFGCINPEVVRSNKNSIFNDFVCTNLVKEFYQWMN